MIGYKVVLKSKMNINKVCYETEDGSLGEDGVEFNYDVLKSNGFYSAGVSVVGITNVDDTTKALLLENSIGKIYVHTDWIKSFEGEKANSTFDTIGDDKVRVTDSYVLDLNSGELIEVNTLPLCNICDTIATITLGKKHICRKCADKLIKLNNYSFKPSPIFIGKQLPADKESNVWYGVEIEVSTDKEKLKEYMIENSAKVYLKSDSSIHGDGYRAEIVTHPHSFSEIMSKNKQTWVNSIGNLPTNDSDRNGMHVHISRTAFTDNKHYSLFYFLLHKMNSIATKVGGRKLTSYCRLRPSGKVHTKTKDSTDSPADRSVFLNEQNKHTVEARFFKATTDIDSIRANVQLLESLVKYTRYHKKTVSVNGWFQYITKKSDKYKELIKKVGTLSDKEKGVKVTYKVPTRKSKTLDTLSVSDLDNVVSIVTKEGVYEGRIKYVLEAEKYIRVLDTLSNKEHSVDYSSIIKFIVEEE